jgi:hypothetical protein
MFYLYDTAIINDFRSIFTNEDIFICPADRVFSVLGRLNEDDVKMYIISLQRTGTSLLSSSHPMRFDGGVIDYDKTSDQFKTLRGIPIRINYLVDVWTKHREENDNIIRELIFHYMTNPTLQITIPYGTNYVHNFNIFFDDNIEDNSDIVEHPNRGEYFRQTLSLYTDDAYLWKGKEVDNVTVDPGFYVKDGNKYVKDN